MTKCGTAKRTRIIELACAIGTPGVFWVGGARTNLNVLHPISSVGSGLPSRGLSWAGIHSW